ncbi:MAG: valine dehydrogenase, partial [Nocardioides sp.]
AGARARLAEQHTDVRIVEGVVDADLDVYAPCALGATLTDDSVSRLRATVVCGAANNQLATVEVADELRRRGVLWVPDFIANAGGLIQVGGELTGATRDVVLADTARIATTVTDLLRLAAEQDSTTSTAARTLVEQRLAAARA